MYSFSKDPFSREIEKIPKFKEYDVSIVNPVASSTDPTGDLARTIRAINQVRPDDHVEIPPRAQFFDFTTISDYEKEFSFSQHELYMEIRNFMVAISRIFKNRYVPFTLYRRAIKAPVGLTFKIFNFLTKNGLINYCVDPKTRPNDTIAEQNLWPKLLYTHHDQIYAEPTFKDRIHPNAPVPGIPIPGHPLMCAPFYSQDRTPRTAEVPGLMTLGSWSHDENAKLIEFLDPKMFNNMAPVVDRGGWNECSRFVGKRTPEECAKQVMISPIFHEAEKAAIVSFKEFNQPKDIIREEVLAKNPSLRVAYTASHLAGEKASKTIMKGKKFDEIESAEMANACLALEKMRDNANYMKQQHKKRILQLLDMAISTTMASIEAKRKMISEQGRDQSATRSESDTSEE